MCLNHVMPNLREVILFLAFPSLVVQLVSPSFRVYFPCINKVTKSDFLLCPISCLYCTAIFYSIINMASKGDNIVSARALYGGTFTMFNDLLPKFGIEVRFVDAEDPANFELAMDENTRAFFCESVSNPALEICDLEEIANGAHRHGLPLIVDSTFSTVRILICYNAILSLLV